MNSTGISAGQKTPVERAPVERAPLELGAPLVFEVHERASESKRSESEEEEDQE